MDCNYGVECAKAVQEFRDLAKEFKDLIKDFENKRKWTIKHQNLYKKICVENDRIETDLTITREHMESSMEFLIAYEINKFDDDSSEDNLHDVVLI